MASSNLFGNLGKDAPKEEEQDAKDDGVNIEEEGFSEAELAAQKEPEEEDDGEEYTPELKVDELAMLKQRATLMGIKYSNNISIDDLRAKVNGKINDEVEEPEVKASEVDKPKVTSAKEDAKAKVKSLRKYLYDENMKLVRIRVTNLDPKDKDLPGQIFTIANEHLGTVSKFVPFGEATEDGYHVPYCIYKFMAAQKFLQIRVTKKNGKEHVETKDVRKFALEILPPLTPKEINRLATAQLAAGSIDNVTN